MKGERENDRGRREREIRGERPKQERKTKEGRGKTKRKRDGRQKERYIERHRLHLKCK